ncbi:MAG: translocation protein TolB [Cyclobacteriaceae bacterium]
MSASARFLVSGLLILLLTQITCEAQRAGETFGKNRIQYRNFEWYFLSGENFDVYYYDARRGVAQEALDYLESEFDRITDLIGYAPYFKTRVFLYNSLADQRQSNVGLNRSQYNVNGELEYVKPYIEVSYLGTSQEFKQELLYKVSHLIVNEMMYGGNLKEMFQSALLLNLSEWFVSGASEYVARGWTAEMDDYIREIIRTKKVNRVSKLSGHEAALVGQSFWNFLAEKYGKSSISNILNYTRITRNEEKSILITLGVTYKQVLAEWHQYYSQMQQQVGQTYISPADSNHIHIRHNRTTEFTTLKISPDGRYLAYAENDRGKYSIKVRPINGGKEVTILRQGSKVISQEVDYRLPIIEWSDANTLGVIAVDRGNYTFWLYDLSTKTKLPRELDKFNNVRSISFSGNGRLAVLSADYEGENDLYLISSRRDRIRRLTNDKYDDLDPTFIPNTNKIVFSSNRVSDSLNTKSKTLLSDLTDNHNLFIFDLDTTKLVLQRVTNTLSKDYAPTALSSNLFYYLSDQRGIINLFKYDRSTSIYSQVTNFATSIKEYDFNAETGTFAIITNRKMRDEIYVSRDFNLTRQVFTPPTRRKELQQARVIRERRKQEENKNMSIRDLINARLKESQEDTAKSKTDSLTVKKDSLQTEKAPSQADSLKAKHDVVNTDNYVFEDEAVKQAQPSESFLNRYMKARDKTRTQGPFPYESRFSADNLITSAVIDPMRGFGIAIERQMNDMLENYRIIAGLMTTVDLRNGDFWGEIQYLPHWLDFSARFDRKGVRWEPFTSSTTFKYSLNRFEVGASLPVNDRTRITFKPFGAMARSVNLGAANVYPVTPPSEEPMNNFYAGVKSELIYDNSINVGMNIIEGTRGKITFTHHQGLNNSDNSFSQIAVDLRHHQKIYKEITFAIRGFAGSFFGKAPKQYLLGGMDNWIVNDTEYDGRTSTGENNPLGVRSANQNILFVEYATNLRGFDYATIFGNNVLLMNAEFRVPIVQALTSGPINSNFFKHLQLIAFYDIGTSWSGKAPFSGETSANVDRIDSPPFQVDIKNYLNPWLYSYGVGARSVFLGYYMKVDVAWPVENYEVGNATWMVTLGFDF